MLSCGIDIICSSRILSGRDSVIATNNNNHKYLRPALLHPQQDWRDHRGRSLSADDTRNNQYVTKYDGINTQGGPNYYRHSLSTSHGVK